MEPSDVDVQLDAVAGGDDRSLGHVLGLPDVGEELEHVVGRERRPVEQLDGGAAV